MENPDNIASSLHYIIIAVLLGGSLLLRYRNNLKDFFKHAGIWSLAILALVLLYSYRYEFGDVKNRLVGELNPSYATKNNDGSMSFRTSKDGHFHIQAEVNGRPVEFLLDTGASDVVFPPDVAKRIGIDFEQLNFNKIYSTANGYTKGAPFVIGTIKIGDIELHNINASVNRADMDKALLGMSFLKNLRGYEVKNGILTIWQ